jgi:hypothetical protein
LSIAYDVQVPAGKLAVNLPAGRVIPDGSDLVPDPHPPRFVILIDPDERIVLLEEQRQVSGRWQGGRQLSIAYDVQVPAGKLAVNLPAGRVIDADRALDERLPLDRALARGEDGGLLFAVHEVARGEDGTFYVVSSVRGTPAYLKEHLPQARRVNLQTTILDVAEQPAGRVSTDGHRVMLARAEADGVHYLWWLAARRRFFTVEQGKRTPQSESPALEVRPGTVRVPLEAFYRGTHATGNLVTASVEVALPGEGKAEPLAKITARARRDVLLLGRPTGAMVYDCIKGGELRPVLPEQITDAAYARGVKRQLQWLRSCDDITPSPQGMLIGPGPGGGPNDR